MPPKKGNPGGGGNGGGGVTFAVLGLDATDDFLTGTGPAGELITVTVSDAVGESWTGETTIKTDGTWSIALTALKTTDGVPLSNQSGDFTVVAVYTEINEKNNKTKTVSTEEAALTLASDNATPNIFVGAGDSATETLAETDAGLTVSGTLAVTDPDASDEVSASISSVSVSGTTTGAPDETALLGMLSLVSPIAISSGATDGAISWLFDSGTEGFDYLAEADSLVLSYTIAVSDGNGGTDSQIVDITITGTSDPEVTPALTAFSYLGEDTGTVGDWVTSDDTATFRIAFNEGVEVGDAITLVVNGGADTSFTLAETDLAARFVDLTTTNALVEGVNAVFANLSTGGNSAAISLTLDTISPVVTGPVTLSIQEGETRTAAFAYASDDSSSIWSLSGPDAAFFQIDADGHLSFEPAPDFEAPADGNGDSVYELTVISTDLAGNMSTRDVTVTVENVFESAPPPTSYTGLVIFGDSLSDNGNFTDLAAAFFVRDADNNLTYSVPFQYVGGDGTVRPYDSRAFTDGTPYSDTLAGHLMLDGAYENYAFGGAEALGSKLGSGYITEYSNLTYTTFGGGTDTFSIIDDTEAALLAYGDFDINLTAQVDRYIAANPGGAPADTLYLFNIGANDLGKFDTGILNILFGGVNEFAEDIGVQIEMQARRVAEIGASGIGLFTLPVAEFFVGYGGLNWLEAPVARDLLDSVNDEIIFRSQVLNAEDITAELVRTDIMSEELLADMRTHGFLFDGPYLYGYSGDPIWVETSEGVIEPTFSVNTAATAYRPEQILFFDEIHPSAALHDMLAVFSSESLAMDEIFGSGGADTFTMTAADDFVIARGGSDVIDLGGNDDVALGGTGNDTIRGEDGSDLIIGGAGSDSLEGGAGSDLLAGSAGNDQLSGGDGSDLLIGGLGSDLVFGGNCNDVFIFFEEALWGGTGGSTDVYDGGDGDNDTLLVFLSSPVESVTGEVVGTTTTLSFGDGGTLDATSIETIELHMGLPEDVDLAGLTGALSDDLLVLYLEGENWGII